ncbi:B-type cyclin [Kickxella alabastrina]|uniref:B-type cyclin n=1 Tax=Kickxella alabastrina TaxID=61397 RepID=A0ACC1IPZ1_9FUNG|nr:B-type cyclin [Kickxella alabastrina]
MFQNKSSTMPLRQRIPVHRQTAAAVGAVSAITDENSVAALGVAATHSAKDIEPATKPGVVTKPRSALQMPTTSTTIGIKTTTTVTAKTFVQPGVVSTASTTTRARSALGEVGNTKAQANVSRLPRLAESSIPTNVVKPASKPPAYGGGPTRARQASAIARPSAASRVAGVMGPRPISKPAANFGARRPHPVVVTAAAAVVAATTNKRSRVEAIADQTSVALGKHTRSGRVTSRLVRSDSAASMASTASSLDIRGYESDDRMSYESDQNMSVDCASTAVGSTVSLVLLPIEPLVLKTSLTEDGTEERKFVAIDTIDYALSHTGCMSEHPIVMTEINAFEDDVDPLDQTQIPEYSDEIFGYMRELEARLKPNPEYIKKQKTFDWTTRSALVLWLVEVHHRFGLLTETLHLCVNFIDRFLSVKEVAIGKLQLVGAVCLLLASKYEETHIPSIKDIIFMVDKNFSEDDILRAERFTLRMLNFDLGWPGPMSFLRRTSKADNFDITTRTLAKYLIDVTLIDHRFIDIPPSKVAATATYLSIKFLGKGVWTRAHAFYSGYFESELMDTSILLIEQLLNPRKHRSIFEKYNDRKFMKASEFTYQYLKAHGYERLLAPTAHDLVPNPISGLSLASGV